MVFNTLSVGAAVTPSVIETYFSHYLNRAPLRHKPTAHISYHEGLRLIREFLDYSSRHTVEDLQAFTAQWVPAPTWVRINNAEIAPKFIECAADILSAQLGQRGLEMIGGKTWWQWRRPEIPLRAEWIEMKKDYHERNRTGRKCERVILYVHGGAYYFGSVDEHRYQMQRHARKLRAQVLSPRYRLAPQFPFPCGLLDCLATYFYLLQHFEPSQILIAGDSAGGGMVLSMLVTLRDQGQPLPAGTILLSPWVDLTHSFPSVAGDGEGDYIPPHGFHHRPSASFPPPPSDGASSKRPSAGVPENVVELPGTAGLDMNQHRKRNVLAEDDDEAATANTSPHRKDVRPDASIPQFGGTLRMVLDGRMVELKEQIQLYTTNALLNHPLVSPVMQPSLGGLPPMLIQTGGAELLKDEQVYLAHKAAHPADYPPNETIMREFDPQRETLKRWPPTSVKLELWEDLCHVPHTLSFTRPAKYMYRSVAQFGAWALAHAQKKSISIQNDDAISFISSGEDEGDDSSSITEGELGAAQIRSKQKMKSQGAVGKAGDPLPPFKDHMIRQRVTRHGIIYPLAPVAEIAALALDPNSIGVPKPGPVRKWLAAHAANEVKFANERKKVDKKRAKELSEGYDAIPGENPPFTALINRRKKGIAPEEKRKGRSWGLAMWSGWGSSHDEQTLQNEQKTENETVRKVSAASALDLGRSDGNLPAQSPARSRHRASSVNAVGSGLRARWDSSRGRDRSRTPDASLRAPHDQDVVDLGQAGDQSMKDSAASSPIGTASDNIDRPQSVGRAIGAPIAVVPTTSITSPSSERIAGTDNTYLTPSGNRPHNGVQAYPFKLKDTGARAASTMTLDSLAPSVADGAETGTLHSERETDPDVSMPVELPGAHENDVRSPAFSSPQNFDDHEHAISPIGTESSHATGQLNAAADGENARALAAASVLSKEAPPVSPVEPATTPFKLRNPVFDQRTSMLGSIGADGMPNAHYAFLREDNPKWEDSTERAAPETDQSNEASKPAPFKIRHTVYEPDITLGKSKAVEYSQLPEHADWLEGKAGNFRSAAAGTRESGVLGTQMGDPRIVGEQRGRSPSYTTPATSTIVAQPLTQTAAARDMKDDSDTPPPPPPKDENYLPMTSKSNGSKTPTDGNDTSAVSTARAAAPKIGNLSFEKAGEQERPRLETFVTAREDLR